MADFEHIKSAFSSLQGDIEALRPRHRSSAAFQGLTHEVIGAIHEVDIGKLAKHPKARNENLIANIEAVQGSIQSFFEYDPGDPPPKLVPYLGNVKQWVVALAGDPTTPPPIIRTKAVAR